MDQHEVYVAFSIHGTNTFITANKRNVELEKTAYGSVVNIDGFMFAIGASRTYSARGAIKLLADELNDVNGPINDPVKIVEFFEKLRAAGWTINDSDFLKRHAAAIKKAAEEKAKLVEENASMQTVDETDAAAQVAIETGNETNTETEVIDDTFAASEPVVSDSEQFHPEQVDDPNLPATAADVPDNLENSSNS